MSITQFGYADGILEKVLNIALKTGISMATQYLESVSIIQSVMAITISSKPDSSLLSISCQDWLFVGNGDALIINVDQTFLFGKMTQKRGTEISNC